ncbi:MAG: hypothetical protein ACJ79L_19035 [Anaeromyxobacteraceae bacterium]
MSRELLVLVALTLAPATASAAEEPVLASAPGAAPAAGTATLPLAELLELRRATQAAASPKAPPPPVRATINKLEIAGRLLDAGLDATAQVEVTVVGDGWATVPLLEVRDGTQLAGLPSVEGAVVAVIQGRLCLVAEKAGAYVFSIHWLQRPASRGQARALELRLPTVSPALLRLQYDESLFRLTSEALRDDGAGAVVYPAAGRITVAWQQRPRIHPREPVRPPVAPVVTAAHASVVATLDGRRLSRIQYRLRFEGVRQFAVTLPPGQAVERVFLNGTACTFTRTGDELSLPIQAARAGDQSAAVELVLSETRSGYPLSGMLSFTLPRPHWALNDLFVTLHLPSVFEYRWAGGSLAAVENPQPVDFAWVIPTPGKTVALHQQLVSSFASVQVAYTVDLARSYYR